jgi:flagellar biosynthesis/type III secretory pathway protein FliH
VLKRKVAQLENEKDIAKKEIQAILAINNQFMKTSEERMSAGYASGYETGYETGYTTGRTEGSDDGLSDDPRSGSKRRTIKSSREDISKKKQEGRVMTIIIFFFLKKKILYTN